MSDSNGIAGAGLARYKLANGWQLRGRPERAVAGYREAVLLEPRLVPAWLELGDLLVRLGRDAEAGVVYRRGLALNPGDPALEGRVALHAGAATSTPLDGTSGPPPLAALPPGAPRILIHTDAAGPYGAGRVNDLLVAGLRAAGLAVTVSLDGAPAPALEPGAPDSPQLVLFSDGSQSSSVEAKQRVLRAGIPYVIVVHLPVPVPPLRPDDPVPELYRAARRVVLVSRASNETLAPLLAGLPVPPVVIPNAIPERFFAAADPAERARVRAGLSVSPDELLVLTSARLEWSKGHAYQLAAIRRLVQAPGAVRLAFAWAGAGTLEAQLRARLGELGLEPIVRMLGLRTDVAPLLSAADVFLLPSEREGMSIAILEAMAAGLPVLATAVGGAAEQLGAAGILLPPPGLDPEPTIAAIESGLRRLAADPAGRARLGAAARARARELFTPDRMIRGYVALIHAVLGG